MSGCSATGGTRGSDVRMFSEWGKRGNDAMIFQKPTTRYGSDWVGGDGLRFDTYHRQHITRHLIHKLIMLKF